MKIACIEEIKDIVVFGFDEYINENNYNVAQTSAKILEEFQKGVNANVFSKTAYFTLIAIESLKLNEIVDYLYMKLEIYLNNTNFDNTIEKKEVDQLLNEIELCKKLLKKENYKIIQTDDYFKASIDYILSKKPESYI
ncbi:hypothetical protein PVA17_23590 [Lysinibacillus sp. CNPSo 3705]|uniref:hypothetical protein n=1 Tax=Lysinibacillus sp. CNPSo 3705 TaxID=3028148 RepID=UPI0023647999|nr:hypothetical protein [Lysinibacillus sp. CNPSo 3705]MDD1505707.1 hypothetical protein [Lysinibacillus sp. CNPSo 3705]